MRVNRHALEPSLGQWESPFSGLRACVLWPVFSCGGIPGSEEALPLLDGGFRGLQRFSVWISAGIVSPGIY